MRAKTLAEHINSKTQANAISAKGTIISVYTDPKNAAASGGTSLWEWIVHPENRTVGVRITATGAAIPRYYPNVGWNSVNVGHFGMTMPKVGDGVMIGFMNGSTEFPYIISHYPGKDTQAAIETSNTPRVAVPAAAVVASHAGISLPNPPPLPQNAYRSPEWYKANEQKQEETTAALLKADPLVPMPGGGYGSKKDIPLWAAQFKKYKESGGSGE